MYPDVMFDLAKSHIKELHKEAARARLVKSRSRNRTAPRASGFWTGLVKLRSKTA